MYCRMSLDWTTISRKAINSASRWRYSGMSRVSSAGTYEMQYTQIIRPHCVSDARARKFLRSAKITAAMGSIRNAYTGIRIAKKPYQSTQIRPYCIGKTTKKLRNNAP